MRNDSLNEKIRTLTSGFIDAVIHELSHASVADLMDIGDAGSASKRSNGSTPPTAPRPAPKATKVTTTGRLHRRSAEEIAAGLERVRKLLKTKDGMRAEAIRVELSMDVREMPRILKEGLRTKVLSSKGHKRATTYFAQ